MAIIELNEHEFLRVRGPDSRKFLQGQLSCNMEMLAPATSLSGALCNLKGRVIADLRILQCGDECLLQTGAGMAEIVLQTLSRYAVFSKVELQLEKLAGPCLGLLDENPQQWQQLLGGIPEDFNGVLQDADLALLRIPGCSPRYEAWCLTPAGRDRVQACAAGSEIRPAGAWQREDVRAGIVHVSPRMSEEYTPQLLNYDISGVINFNKGCYTGQEVVARMHYRAKAKQRLYLLHSPAAISADSRLQQQLDGNTRDAEILAYSNDAEANFLLAILDTGMVEGGARFSLAAAPDALLQLVALPYFEGSE